MHMAMEPMEPMEPIEPEVGGADAGADEADGAHAWSR